MLDRRLPRGVRIGAPLALLFVLLLLVGCGGESSSPTTAEGPDPAGLAPAGTTLYVEATVRPSGDMKAGAVAAARKVLRAQDPGAELRRLLDKDTSDGTRFSRDWEPWLGDRVGIFLLAPVGRSRDFPWVGVTSIADRGAFDDAFARMRRSGARREVGSYRGVRYYRVRGDDPDDYAAAVGDFYIEGRLRGLRAAVDVFRGGDSLAESSRFTDALDAVPGDALAFAWFDAKALLPALAARNAPPVSRRAIEGLAQSPIVASLTANADEIAIEASGKSQLADTEDSDAKVTVGQLPGDAWLALATPPIGPIVREALDGAGVHDQAAAQVRTNLGLDLDRDLLEPLGGLGLFVRGESPLDLGGGVLVQLTDAAAAQRLLTRIQTVIAAGAGVPVHPTDVQGGRGFDVQIPQSPAPIVVLAKGDKLAAGYAASSAEDLLDPQQRFDESDAGRAALATLGDGYEPSLVVIVPPVAGLLKALDQLEVADLAPAIPYVQAYRSLAIGSKRDGDRATVRIVAALR